MSKGRLEAKVTIPAGGWGGTIDDSGAGGAVAWTIAAGEYYPSSLLTALSDALNLAAPTDTITVSASLGEGGTGKVSITSSGNATIVWTSSDLRDLLGYAANLTLTASAASVSPSQMKALWIADCHYDAPNAISPWTGWPEGDARSTESPGGRVFSLFGRKKRATWLRWEAVQRTRASQANESTVNESFERFLIDGIWGDAVWATPGGYLKFYPDASGSSWVEYAVVMPKEFKPQHFVDGWAGGPWKCGFDRLVVQDQSGGRDDIAFTSLTAGSSTTDGTSIATSSITPTGSRAIYAAVVSHEGTLPNTPTCSGNGLTWVQVCTVVYNSLRRLTVFRAMGSSPTTGAVTFDFAGQTQTAFCWSIVEADGADTSGTNASGATVQSTTNTATSGTTITGTLAALENAANAHLAFVALNVNTTVAHDGDFAELSDNGVSAAPLALEAEWAINQLTCSPTFATAVSAIACIEVKAAAL